MTFFSNLASAGMAVGPPLVYTDQLVSIIRRKDSSGFSMDVCGVLLTANIIRIFFWFGERFEVALLIQSLLMIGFQLVLLYACIEYRKNPLPHANDSVRNRSTSATGLLSGFASGGFFTLRPYNLWQWQSYGTYVEFLAGVIGINTFLYILFSGFQKYVDAVGLIALGLESTLPIPQLISNYQRKSLAGFRMTVLAGWLFGDAFKTIYFFLQEGNSWQFKATACFQLSVDIMILGQARLYRDNPTPDSLRQLPDEELGNIKEERTPRESMETR